MRVNVHAYTTMGAGRVTDGSIDNSKDADMVSHPTSAAVARDGTSEVQARPVPYTALFQPNRLDVIVHLRALVELSDMPWPLTGPGDNDWLARSDRFADIDGEPSVLTMGVDADLDTALPKIGFGSGGGLVRGATAAAAGIHSGAELYRTDASGTSPRRAQSEMRAAGYSSDQLRSLARTWLHFDTSSAVVVVRLTDDEAAHAALHELRCRYSEFHTELDHLSSTDLERLGVDTGAAADGSVQVVFVSGLKDSFDDVVSRHAAIVAHGRGTAALLIASTLFDPDRAQSTSPEHEQRIRKQRRRDAADQLLERVLGR